MFLQPKYSPSYKNFYDDKLYKKINYNCQYQNYKLCRCYGEMDFNNCTIFKDKQMLYHIENFFFLIQYNLFHFLVFYI